MRIVCGQMLRAAINGNPNFDNSSLFCSEFVAYLSGPQTPSPKPETINYKPQNTNT